MPTEKLNHQTDKSAREAAEKHGREKALPEIRSMWPSESRGVMALHFEKSFLEGATWAEARHGEGLPMYVSKEAHNKLLEQARALALEEAFKEAASMWEQGEMDLPWNTIFRTIGKAARQRGSGNGSVFDAKKPKDLLWRERNVKRVHRARLKTGTEYGKPLCGLKKTGGAGVKLLVAFHRNLVTCVKCRSMSLAKP